MKANNIPYIIIIALLIVVIIDRCKSVPSEPGKTITIVKIDTLNVHDTVTKTKLKYVKGDSIPYAEWDTLYLPDTTYDGVKRQYIAAMTNFLTKRYYSDTLNINKDSLQGWMVIQDTLFKNELQKRSYRYNLAYTQKTITIIQPTPPVRQLYFGGGITGTRTSPVSGLNVGLIYKDKKDVMFGAHVGFSNELQYGISIYQKIKLK